MIFALLLLQAAAAAPASVPAPPPAPPPWAVVLRGAPPHVATTTSAWSSDGKARLVVRCDTTADKIVSIQLIPKAGFVAATPRPVSINVDDGGWLGTNWQFPGTGAFVSDDAIVTNLAVMIAHGKSIRIRAIDPDNAPFDATFTGPGEAPIRAVLSACNYTFGMAPPRQAPPPPAPKSETEDDQ